MLCLTPNVVMKVSWRLCVLLSRDIIALIRWRNVMSYDLVISYLPCENFISQRFTTLSPRSITKSHCIPSCWAFGSSSSLQGISKASFVSALASFVGSSPRRVYGDSEVLTKKTSKVYGELSQTFQKQHKMAELLGVISADFYVSCWYWLKILSGYTSIFTMPLT